MSVNSAYEMHHRLFYSPVLKRLIVPFFRPVLARAKSENSEKHCYTRYKVWNPILINLDTWSF